MPTKAQIAWRKKFARMSKAGKFKKFPKRIHESKLPKATTQQRDERIELLRISLGKNPDANTKRLIRSLKRELAKLPEADRKYYKITYNI